MSAEHPKRFDTHRIEAMVENVDDLVAMGESKEHALAQVGITADRYDKHRDRRKARRG